MALNSSTNAATIYWPASLKCSALIPNSSPDFLLFNLVIDSTSVLWLNTAPNYFPFLHSEVMCFSRVQQLLQPPGLWYRKMSLKILIVFLSIFSSLETADPTLRLVNLVWQWRRKLQFTSFFAKITSSILIYCLTKLLWSPLVTGICSVL